MEVSVLEFVQIELFPDFLMLRYSGGLFEICSPYVYAVFRLFRYSGGLSEICSPYVCAVFSCLGTVMD